MFVLLGVDVEPDRPDFGGKRYDYFGFQKWACLSKGIPEFLCIRDDLQKELETDIRLTWFFRSDSQIKMIYGNAAWAIEQHKGIIDKVQESKDEIGWHAHTWRWNKDRGSWYQEINDNQWIEHCYKTGFSDFRKSSGFAPTSFRAGWCFHNNISMTLLEELGIEVDLSAMPGIKNSGNANTPDGSLFKGFADWERTPAYPYYPSKEDYQIPGNNHYEVLEIPVTTFKKPLVSYIHQILPFRIFGGIKLAKPELTLSKYALSPTCDPLLFKRGILAVLKRFKQSEHVFLVASFHADELLSRISLDNLLKNIRQTVTICKKRKLDIRFTTAKEAFDLCQNNYSENNELLSKDYGTIGTGIRSLWRSRL